jgi:mediator of RNA polymerase II transcription subunit 5
LTVAGFDVLSCAVGRNESSQTLFALKSFLINKVPPLLSALAGSMFPSLTPEYCITQALGRVDLNTFPSFGMGMLSNSVLQDVRQEFIYGCTLHGLLPVESVDRLLGETPFTPPPTQDSRYHKDVLSQQCATEPGKVVQLISQLEKLDGNAGAIVAAVTEVRFALTCE